MAKKRTNDENKTDDIEPVVEDAEEGAEPKSLTGSGAEFVEVTANARVLGLVPGERGRLLDTDEVRANIEVGNLLLVSGD